MNRTISTGVVSIIGVLCLVTVSLAQHMHGGMSGSSMKMDTKEVLVEGTKVTFQMMANAEHQKMLKDMKMKENVESGTTHNITVSLKDAKSQKEITDAEITMKVVDPKGKDQVKQLKYDSDLKSYDAYFNLPDKGKYQVMVLVKQGDQKKTAGIYYDVN